MAIPLHRRAIVARDGTLAVRVPELAPGQHVRVTIEPEPYGQVRRAIDQLEGASEHRQFGTAAAVDAYIQSERDAWER